MKSFFEEYGFVILAAIVVILLIAMATPIGDLVKIQVSEVVNSFGSKTQSKLNATDGIIQVRVSTANNKIILEWDANKKEDVFKYSYKASNTKDEANWTNKADVTANEKSRTVIIENDSNNQPLANKTKVEYKIYDSNDQLIASGIVTAKVGKNATTGGSGGTGGDPDGGSTENPSTPIETLTAGQKITIENREYTVIECNGTQCKVLATETSKRKFAASSNEYVKSEIATYLDGEYYEKLPESIRNAIVETSIQQKNITSHDYSSGSWVVKYNESQTRNAGTHKVFLPSWEEVTKIYGTTPEGLKAYALNDSTWFRDAHHSLSNVLSVSNNGNLHNSYPFNNCCVRPAFVIDLSNVDYQTVK